MLPTTLRGCAALGAAVLAACGSTPVSVPRPAVGASLLNCAALANAFGFDQTRIESTAAVAAGTLTLGGQPVAAHCLVKGKMHERKGSDGRDYAIGFEMRLPQAWNGRFYHQANGGLDGNVVVAQGALGGGPVTGALMQGFAVISSDAGHTGPQTPFFGLEPQARLDYGYQAVAKLTPMAKALIASAYGKGPDRSYIGGCSNGGRHVLVAAARYAGDYDGYLAGAPGYRLPLAAAAQLRGAQLWSTLATPGATVRHPTDPNGTLPDLGTAFTSAERQSVARAILGRCDEMDGLRDGLVQATQACQAAFDLQRDLPTCAGARDGGCLTSAQKSRVSEVFAGVKTASGAVVYAPFPLDPGVSGANWAQWKFVNALALDPLAAGAVFSVPPGRVDPLADDIAARLPLFQARNDTYPESGLSFMTPPGAQQLPDLDRLRARGAKMVLYHGVSDPVFSAEDTRQWFERVDRASSGRGSDTARYFPVPGMNHCSGGPATDQFDLLAPLVRWVEEGVAPQGVTARARGTGSAGGTVNAELPADWSPTRSRPLCAYPAVARYKGSGDPEDASNFACR